MAYSEFELDQMTARYSFWDGHWNGFTAAYIRGGNGWTEMWVSLAVDRKGVPHIAYYDPINGDLRYTTGINNFEPDP